MDSWTIIIVVLILGAVLGLCASWILRKAPNTRDPLAPEQQTCIHCATPLKPGARLCRSCLGVVIPLPVPPSQGRAETRQASERWRRENIERDQRTRDRSGA